MQWMRPSQLGTGWERSWKVRPTVGAKSLDMSHSAMRGLSVRARQSFSGGVGEGALDDDGAGGFCGGGIELGKVHGSILCKRVSRRSKRSRQKAP